MSSFVQDNLDRFDKIHSDYNNIANSISNLTRTSPDDDLKSKVEMAGSGVESAANLYLEGRKMVHELKSAKLQKGVASALKEAGERNARHLTKNNQLLSRTLDRIKNQGARDKTLSTGIGEPTDREALNESLKQRYQALPEEAKPGVVSAVRGDPKFVAKPQSEDDFKSNLSIAKENIEKAEGTPAPGSATPAPPQAPEAPPTAPTPAPKPAVGEVQTGGEVPRPTADEDPFSGPRQLSQTVGRVSTDDAPAPSRTSTARTVANGASRELEDDVGDTAARTAATAATTATEEGVGGVLDAIPGLDILGLALGAIGGVTSAVAGAIPDKEPKEAEPPKQVSIGGNFSQQSVQQGGSTA